MSLRADQSELDQDIMLNHNLSEGISLATGEWQSDSVHCGDATEVVDVTNPITGRTWMDRNIGANRVALSRTDTEAYGYLFQWGRVFDGHQCRDSEVIFATSDSDQPGHSDFMASVESPYDWRSPHNHSLWQGLDGINNPCPVGYRIPTQEEFSEERASWSTDNANGAFNSPLKWTLAGYRFRATGTLEFVNERGRYWTSDTAGTNARAFRIFTGSISFQSNHRAIGNSVRCIKV